MKNLLITIAALTAFSFASADSVTSTNDILLNDVMQLVNDLNRAGYGQSAESKAIDADYKLKVDAMGDCSRVSRFFNLPYPSDYSKKTWSVVADGEWTKVPTKNNEGLELYIGSEGTDLVMERVDNVVTKIYIEKANITCTF